MPPPRWGRPSAPSMRRPARLRQQVSTGNLWDLTGTPDLARFGEVADRMWAVVCMVAAALVDQEVGVRGGRGHRRPRGPALAPRPLRVHEPHGCDQGAGPRGHPRPRLGHGGAHDPARSRLGRAQLRLPPGAHPDRAGDRHPHRGPARRHERPERDRGVAAHPCLPGRGGGPGGAGNRHRRHRARRSSPARHPLLRGQHRARGTWTASSPSPAPATTSCTRSTPAQARGGRHARAGPGRWARAGPGLRSHRGHSQGSPRLPGDRHRHLPGAGGRSAPPAAWDRVWPSG
jgi:hypothetical protein